MRSKEKGLPSANTPGSALRETVLLSAASSCAASYVRMHTTLKHHAAGNVKRTVPYKDFCIIFINWGMATDIKLTSIKKELKKKGLIILYVDNIKWQ
jgi:hypothetical protein